MTPAELFPTPTRRRLAAAIAVGDVRHYHWTEPWTCWLPTDRRVTDDVAKLVRHGIAELGEKGNAGYSTVQLTLPGQQWLADAGGAP